MLTAAPTIVIVDDAFGRTGTSKKVTQSGKDVKGCGTIGLLLDLDEGTLSVFKNGRRLGVMKDGLGGEYVWFVSVFSACLISMSKGSAPN